MINRDVISIMEAQFASISRMEKWKGTLVPVIVAMFQMGGDTVLIVSIWDTEAKAHTNRRYQLYIAWWEGQPDFNGLVKIDAD